MTYHDAHTTVRPVLLGALASETLKLWTLHSQRALAAVALLVIVGTGVLFPVSMRSRTGDPRFAGQTITAEPIQLVDSVLWAQIVVAVVAVLAVTGEYSSGQARLSLLATPARWPWLAAKTVVIAGLGLVIGTVGVLSSLAVSVLVLMGSEVVYVVEPGEAVVLALRSGAYLAAIAALATGVAAAVRHGVVALTAVLALLIVAPALMGSIPELREAAGFTPTHAGRLLISDLGSAAQLGPWTGFAVLVLWAVAAVLVAGLLLRTRDA